MDTRTDQTSGSTAMTFVSRASPKRPGARKTMGGPYFRECGRPSLRPARAQQTTNCGAKRRRWFGTLPDQEDQVSGGFQSNAGRILRISSGFQPKTTPCHAGTSARALSTDGQRGVLPVLRFARFARISSDVDRRMGNNSRTRLQVRLSLASEISKIVAYRKRISRLTRLLANQTVKMIHESASL